VPLTSLVLDDLRCIERAELEFSPGLNLISGPNGSGKTSILEGIFLLGRGRSFRTRNSERLIRFGRQRLVSFGRTRGEGGEFFGSAHTDDRCVPGDRGDGGDGGEPGERAERSDRSHSEDSSVPDQGRRAAASGAPTHALGIQITRGKGTIARVDAAPVGSLAELSIRLPVQVINPEIHTLVEEGPSRRRRWLDWAVFHVEPGFMGHWARYQRALKQRNAALRRPGLDLGGWNHELVIEGTPITEARRRVIERLIPSWERLTAELAGVPVRLGYQQGWPDGVPLAEALSAGETRDRERGASSVGPHRADMTLRVEGRAAREVLSRGQQKLVAIALTLAQLEYLREERDLRPTLLLDDPQAELDAVRLQGFLGRVRDLDCQLVVTSLESESSLFGPAGARFHVEQGRVESR
jgi:DNA replication and repair protein RecF